jgi:hypothetical protein
LGVVAIKQQIRSDLCHSLLRQEEHMHFHTSNQSSLDSLVSKQPHPASILNSMRSNKRLRKPDWGKPLPVRGHMPKAAQLACYWLSNWTQHPVGLIPKGITTAWFSSCPVAALLWSYTAIEKTLVCSNCTR